MTDRNAVTSIALLRLKQRGEKITCVTSYDASFTRVLEAAEVEALLVGDSLGMVVLGYDSTVPVTMEEMLHHAGAVSRNRALEAIDAIDQVRAMTWRLLHPAN